MIWLRNHRRSAIIIGLTLMLPVGLYLNILLGMLSLRLEAQGRISDLTPRIARMQGLIENEASLRESAGQVDTRLAELGYPATEDANSVAATLQSEVRQLFAESGMAVSNSQVMPTRKGEVFDRIAIKLTANGGIAALDAALIGVAAFQPMLLVETMDVFPARGRGRGGEPEAQEVTTVIQLLALRLLP